MSARRRLTVAHESWPIAGSFSISRGTKTSAEVVTVTMEQDGAIGRGESVPYARYDESIDGVVAAIEAAREALESGAGRPDVPCLVEPRAARNALDCALWDLEAKMSGTPVWQLAGLSEPAPLTTAYTLSLDEPVVMADAAASAVAAGRPLLKLKLGKSGDAERLHAIRKAAPTARLIIDANEGWTTDNLKENLTACADAGIELIEQPLPASDDEALRSIDRPVTICADESAHDSAGLDQLLGKYDAINVKTDKTGGLTEALATARAAKTAGLEVMTGCMLATSLAMAPAMLVAQFASVVDLDGPLLLAGDREPGIHFDGAVMHPAPAELWG